MLGPGDLRPLRLDDVPAVRSLWADAIGPVFPLRPEVLTRCLARGGSLRPEVVAHVVERDGRLLAFAFMTTHDRSTPDHPTPRLQAVVVDPTVRRRGLGAAVLDALGATARTLGATTLACGGGHDYLWPAIPEDLAEASPFLRQAGFALDGVSHDLRSTDATASAARRARDGAAALGVAIRPAAATDVTGVLDLVASEFDPAWVVDLREALEDGLQPTDLVVAADPDGRLVGFARIHQDDRPPVGPPLYWSARLGPAPGGLGPIGVAADQRGRGLGKALLGGALAILADRGAHDIVIDFTDQLAFYGRLGFVSWLRYQHASRPL